MRRPPLDSGAVVCTAATPSALVHAPVPFTPANVDGNIPQLQPATALDMRLILWPYVSFDLVKAVMANIHIPSDYRLALER